MHRHLKVVRCRGNDDWDANRASLCDTWNGLFLKKAALQHFLHTSQTEPLFKHPPAESSGAERKQSPWRELAVQLLVCLPVLIRETFINPLWAAVAKFGNLLYHNHNYCICRVSPLSLLTYFLWSLCFQASPRHQPRRVWWRRPLWNHRWLWDRTQLWLRSVWEGEASKWFDFFIAALQCWRGVVSCMCAHLHNHLAILCKTIEWSEFLYDGYRHEQPCSGHSKDGNPWISVL